MPVCRQAGSWRSGEDELGGRSVPALVVRLGEFGLEQRVGTGVPRQGGSNATEQVRVQGRLSTLLRGRLLPCTVVGCTSTERSRFPSRQRTTRCRNWALGAHPAVASAAAHTFPSEQEGVSAGSVFRGIDARPLYGITLGLATRLKVSAFRVGGTPLHGRSRSQGLQRIEGKGQACILFLWLQLPARDVLALAERVSGILPWGPGHPVSEEKLSW